MPLLSRRDLEFCLYEMMDTEGLLQHPRYTDHSRETFSQTMDTAEQVAERYFAPHNQLADEKEPWFDGEQVHTIPEVKEAFRHYVNSGLLNARLDFDEGGMQLPHIIAAACSGYITCANPSSAAYPFLTMAAANLIKHFASDDLKSLYLPLMRTGIAAGTMALTEPDTGSSLADIKTSATPVDGGHYLIRGNKMYISGGDQDITDNIVHLVLAKIKGAPAGVKGISLFLVPKWLVDENGQPLKRNDVKLAGLLHKMGYRGTTSTVLNFGEQDQCVGYLIGEAHQGLKYMFMMMNEARVGVGLGAAVIGYRGYVESLAYARERPQGRHPSNKNPESKPVAIIEHADVKRMLLAQKAYAEGSIALCLYANHLIDRIETCDDKDQRKPLQELLDLLTPIVKSWPSEFGPKANSLAVQVLGGAGYIREYPVEQCYRDNRLNPIHEGTHGIQAMDLLGRKLWQSGSLGLQTLATEIQQTLQQAAEFDELHEHCQQLQQALALMHTTTQNLGVQLQQQGPDIGLANASAYLSLSGHIVVAWLWLWQATAAMKALQSGSEEDFYRGKLHGCQFFFRWELPKIQHWSNLLQSADDTCRTMQNNYF
ncbi:acyl-CoA dehydrogenase [Ketobacter alkanivorans]|uniref:Acyl-CoA dehydrogenase n=1 Tax=Ketobacter alkanivorans TaxID=1917421 RepID=A0A2K9LHW5_9GAMM|nr:acyl-CoA dehydrogenase [Ketobacter alkanivorans]AUM11830.1 acyl-CoA dehydrogenase [Ketobacter alkanivorans]